MLNPTTKQLHTSDLQATVQEEVTDLAVTHDAPTPSDQISQTAGDESSDGTFKWPMQTEELGFPKTQYTPAASKNRP